LTTDNGRFTVGRARLAPAMISTPGHRASRRRQREALRAWCKLSGQLQATRLNPRTTLPRFGLMPRRTKAAALEHQLPFPQTMMVSRFDELTVAGNRWFESTSLQRRVNELSVPLDEGVFEPPDLLQTRMNGGDQIVVEADQILRRPRAISRPRARATEAKR